MKPSARNLVMTLTLTSLSAIGAYGQTQMASLRPGRQVLWHRTSPSLEKPDGPVLYQLLLNASGTPGNVPVFDSNPRHLINSPITVTGGNVSIGGGERGLSIDGRTGLISFASGQTFPGGTGVNLVSSGDNFIVIGGTAVNPTVGLNTTNTDARYLTFGGGTMLGNITFAAGQTFPASGFPNLAGEVTGPPGATVVSNAVADNAANAIVRRDGSGNFLAGSIALAGSLALPNTASASVGVLTFGGHPFLHNYGVANTFVGRSAGNMTTTGHSNAAFGFFTLTTNTTGNSNSAFGTNALLGNTTGFSNSAFGRGAMLFNTEGNSNSAFGDTALGGNTTACCNSAFGVNALESNTARGNSAFGTSALQSNTTATDNSAFGFQALRSNTTGEGNSAFGNWTLDSNTTADLNSAFGSYALFTNTTGSNNTAFGPGALRNLVSGNNNIAIGLFAGLSFAGSESNNIDIGNSGTAGESNTIRIGDGTTQTATFIAGISGATSASGVNVFVNSAGQLGTATSSRRFKWDIADLDVESDVLMKLRPVAFYYKPELDSTHTRQYGLVAEEVAQIAPGLVAFDQDGRPQTVRYHFVNAMLLNEVQKQRRLLEQQQQLIKAQQKENEEQRSTIDQQQAEIGAMQAQLKEIILRLAAVERSVPATQLASAR